jgi:hypothetical protein
MKNIVLYRSFFLFIIFAGIFGFMACESEVTDLSPFNRLTEADAFATPERCELSMVGVYDAAQSGFYLGNPPTVRGYPFGAANVEQGDMRGEDMLNVAAFYAFTYDGTYTTTTANNDFHWQTLYGMINKANLIVEGITAAGDAGTISAETAAGYVGEARFLRALAHHELLVHFARPYAFTSDASHPGVPYKDFAVNTLASLEQSQMQGRNTVAECYSKILDDLNAAEAGLPETRTGGKNISRATKGAAIALKSRVYLHMGRWADVITEANKLTGGVGGYALTAEPEGPFASFSGNSESIFSIENNNADNPFVNAALPVMYSVAPGRALVAISPISYNAPWWLETDKRRTQLVKNNGRAYFSNKYRNVTAQDDWNPIIRYAEVLLNAAEAHARLSAMDPGLESLNQVRNRAVEEADVFILADFADANALIDAILKERRIEFLAEGRRWADIHRLAYDPTFTTNGVPSKTLYTNTTFASWGYGVDYDGNGNFTGDRSRVAIPLDNFRFIWPIPQSELNTNAVLEAQQNPGY